MDVQDISCKFATIEIMLCIATYSYEYKYLKYIVYIDIKVLLDSNY